MIAEQIPADFGYVFASKMLVDTQRKVRFMYREESSGADSGWRFFCGDESQAYTDNPDNIAIYDIKTILAVDNTIYPHLSAPVNVAFEREDEKDLFSESKAVA